MRWVRRGGGEQQVPHGALTLAVRNDKHARRDETVANQQQVPFGFAQGRLSTPRDHSLRA